MGKKCKCSKCKCSECCQAMVMSMAAEAGEARRLLAEYVECWDQENATPPLRTWHWAFDWRQRVKAFLCADCKEA